MESSNEELLPILVGRYQGRPSGGWNMQSLPEGSLLGSQCRLSGGTCTCQLAVCGYCTPPPVLEPGQREQQTQKEGLTKIQ